MASARSNLRDYVRSSALFDEALRLDANNPELQMDAAEDALASGDLGRAKLLAAKSTTAEQGNARAHRIFGRALLQAGEQEKAKQELEKAVAIEPDFTNGYALATAYLTLKEKDKAAGIFREMQASFGDTAAIHMQFGLAYGEAGFPDDAIPEFQKTIAEDAAYPGAHYSLGASYLLSMGEIDFPQAAAAFQSELALHPDDVLSHAQLGYIELSQHKYDEAEKELRRATELNPRDPDTFVSLGQLYVDTSRPSDAEPALRKAIALTADPAHNHYQVQRAHYLLGRILLQTGRREEAKTEMQTSTDLLKLSTLQNQGKTAEEIAVSTKALNLPKREMPTLDTTALQQVEKLEGELSQPVADSYNNLGVTAAREGNYAAAVEFLEKASQWNPTLDGLDVNLGRAAYMAKLYAKAVQPLRHVLDRDPKDAWFRTALGVSLFMTGDYSGTVNTLRPMEASLNSTPGIEPIYGAALVQAGDVSDGIARLTQLAVANPNNAELHRLLGKAYLKAGDKIHAEAELRATMKIDPSDAGTQRILDNLLVKPAESIPTSTQAAPR